MEGDLDSLVKRPLGTRPVIRFVLLLKLLLVSVAVSSCAKRGTDCVGPYVTVPMAFAVQKITSYDLPRASEVLPAAFPEDEPLAVYTLRVGTDGHVCEVTPVRSSEGLLSAAIEDAIKKWQFRPTWAGKEKLPTIAKSTWYLYARRENGNAVFVLPGLKEH